MPKQDPVLDRSEKSLTMIARVKKIVRIYILLISLVTSCQSWYPVNPVCGQVNANVQCKAPVVFGGQPSCAEKSPWNAIIQLTDRRQQDQGGRILVHCGGTITGPRHVLTAAHCVWSNSVHTSQHCPQHMRHLTAEECRQSRSCDRTICLRVAPNMITVLLGVTHVEERIRTSREVTRIILHPGWNKTLSFDTSGNDLALLVLQTAITEWSDRIQPACLPVPDNLDLYRKLVATGKIVEASGMGVTRASGGRADIIQHVDLTILPQDQCKKGNLGVTGDQHCALGDKGTNLCSGDSGSGLVVQEEDESYTLIGVASTSAAKCGASGVASTYSNLVSRDRIEWIHDNMCVTDDANVVLKNGRNTPCVLPFTYQGVTYTLCTEVDSKWPWCSLLTVRGEHIDFANTSTGEVVQTWGYCRRYCRLPVGYQTLSQTTRSCPDNRLCVSLLICPEATQLTEEIKQGASLGGDTEEILKKFRMNICNKEEKGYCCPAVVNGGWSEYSSCSVTSGVRVQTRTCTAPQPSGGGSWCVGKKRRKCTALSAETAIVLGGFNQRYRIEMWEAENIGVPPLPFEFSYGFTFFTANKDLIIGDEDEIYSWKKPGSSWTKHDEPPENINRANAVLTSDGETVLVIPNAAQLEFSYLFSTSKGWQDGEYEGEARLGACLVSLADKKEVVFIGGGKDRGSATDKVEALSETGRFIRDLPKLRKERMWHGCSKARYDGRDGILVVGGSSRDSAKARLDSVEFLADDETAWEALRDLPYGVWAGVLRSIGGVLHLFGGVVTSHYGSTDKVLQFTESGSWQEVGKLEKNASAHGVVVIN